MALTDSATQGGTVGARRTGGACTHRGGRRSQDVRLFGPRGLEGRRPGRHQGARALPRAHGARLGRRRGRRDAGRRRRAPAEVVAGMGTAARTVGRGRLGGLALGRSRLVLPPQWVADDHRSLVAHAPALARPRCADFARRPRPGRRRRDGGAPATGDRSDRPGPVGRRGPHRARPRRQRPRPRPVLWLGGAADGTAPPPQLPHGYHLGAGPGGLARRRGEPGRRVVASAPPGRRRAARRARRGVPGGECPDVQRAGRAGGAGPPGRRALRGRLTGAAGRPGYPRRSPHRRTVAPAGACWLARPGTGRPQGRRPAQRHVLGGVRPPRPFGSRRRGRVGARAARVRVQPDGWGPPAGVPPLRRTGAVRRAAARPRRNRAARRCCAVRVATTRARSCARPAAGSG